MTASIVSLSIENGVPRFYCPFCAATVFDDNGNGDDLCKHVKVLVYHSVGELYFDFPAGVTDDLADKLEELGSSDPSELSALFGDDTFIFELVEPGRGGGHDTSSRLVVLSFQNNEVDG